jgi:hypothetical protein
MGVDISGMNPQVIGERPKQLDWDVATDEDRKEYFDKMDEFYHNNPGVYFRSNWWGWRPIHAIANMSIIMNDLSLNTELWGENSGGGLKTHDECNALADAIESFMMQNSADMEDGELFYLCLGGWVKADHSFAKDEDEDELNQQYPIGTILHQGVVNGKGELMFPAHSCSYSHIKNFIKFLRNCGGFEIW